MRARKLIFLSTLSCFMPAVAAAEEAAPTAVEDVQYVIRDKNRAPTLELGTGFVGSGFELNTDSDGSEISLAISRNQDGMFPGDPNDFSTISLKFTAPVTNKEEKSGTFLTERGLPDTLSVDFGFTHAFVPDTELPDMAELRTLTRAGRESCARQAVADDKREACQTATLGQLIRGEHVNLTARDKRRIFHAFDTADVWLLGFSASIGREKFDFRQRTDFSEKSVHRTPYSVSGFLGLSPSQRPIYLGAGFEHRRSYEDADEQTLCPSVAPGTVIECFTSPFDGPTKNIDSSVYGLFRWKSHIRLSDDRELPFGLEIRAAYDLEDKVFGIGMPIYFLPGSDGLKGGAKLQWDDEKGFKFGVFVGSTFKLFGG